jgi:hypothetical protein
MVLGQVAGWDDRDDRNGSQPGKREVDLYVRTYNTLLESSGAVSISSLEPAHLTASSSLHAGAVEPAPDLSAFLYSANRIPRCIVETRHIILGQSYRAFSRAGYGDIDTWEDAKAPARRRKWYWDRKDTLGAYISSASDLDDLIPSIVAYQIEWNKMHDMLRAAPEVRDRLLGRVDGPIDAADPALREALALSEPDLARLGAVWGDELMPNLRRIAADHLRIDLRMLGGTYLGYGRSVRSWWRPVAEVLERHDLVGRPVYFVSSNTHSIANVLSGVSPRREQELTDFIRESNHPELLPELQKRERGSARGAWENVLYFAARSYFHGPHKAEAREVRQREEEAVGITYLEPAGSLDVGVQVIELAKLDPQWFDPRLTGLDPIGSDAVIVNINYPLGMAAYHIMSQIGAAVENILGVYVLGKAATLNGRIGDIMMCNVVFDEHSGNTYWFENAFTYDAVAPYLTFGSALDSQKAVTVLGTYLQNEGYLDFYYRENFTVVEMEAGPYLSALYEDVFLERHPSGEAINLSPLSRHIDLGIIHYASDTPFTRAHTLGARGMSFYGMDSTYASTIAILHRIFDLEAKRVGEG